MNNPEPLKFIVARIGIQRSENNPAYYAGDTSTSSVEDVLKGKNEVVLVELASGRVVFVPVALDQARALRVCDVVNIDLPLLNAPRVDPLRAGIDFAIDVIKRGRFLTDESLAAVFAGEVVDAIRRAHAAQEIAAIRPAFAGEKFQEVDMPKPTAAEAARLDTEGR